MASLVRSWILGPPNKSFQPTKPLVTALAGTRPAPNVYAAEAADGTWTEEDDQAVQI